MEEPTFATNENDPERKDGNDGVSLGNYININIAGEINKGFDDFVLETDLYQHEYGHYVQSQYFGLSYLFAVGLPSFISSSTSSSEEHDNRWYERQADRYASRYFKRKFGI